MANLAGGMQMTPEQRYLLFKIDMETKQQLYDAMVTNCFKKCVNKLDYEVDAEQYRWGELTIKEMSCTDRCVQKYVQSQELAQKRMEKIEMQKQQQMAMQQNVQQRLDSLGTVFGTK
mmetsp:Transcript_56175/g.93616  ORF Transcript_56175/g.93616 Transcript_56175/m.93616 type:complete len:117 (+) Transcript_56175:38-388(+)